MRADVQPAEEAPTVTPPFSEILCVVDGDTATVTLNRPDALNAITPTMLGELNAAFAALAAHDGLRFVVLTGAGRAFSAGVDLKALGERRLVDGKVGDILDLPARALIEKIETLPLPVVARVNGFCFTGALELVLACDLVVVAAEAKLGDTHAKWAIRPTWGMSQRLPRRVGIARARELSYTARTLSGADALALGIANACVPLAELDAAVAGLVDEMRPNSAEAFAAYKDLYRVADNRGLAEGLRYEAATDYPFSETDARLAAFRK
ncbi:MAG: enoyl-CoA hydratase/isomerase family protein [Gammaproteobacteria bacterium]|nr:enoyl-CoA hydratase/isomerase family protein [Gammaproteobacteria bacterium]MCP5202219.1 enoyl-CoA hydratase/isomerase family protein [Gammaproteobacteria bacterium]